MIRYFLTRLQVEGFRGINNDGYPLDLKFKTDAVNSIFAANGLGKSSIFEALSYAIKGYIPKLQVLPSAERAEDYYCNRFHSTNTASILLTLTPDDGTGDIELRVVRHPDGTRSVDSPSGYSNPEKLLSSLDEELVFLDYKAFQRFIEDTPLRRGRTFSSLLGLTKLSEMRQALEILSNQRNLNTDFEIATFKNKLEERKQQIQSASSKIQTSYQKLMGELPETFDRHTISNAVSDSLKQVQLLQPFFEAKEFSEISFDEIRRVIKEVEGSEKREQLSAIVKDISELEVLEPGTEEAADRLELRALVEAKEDALGQTSGPLFFKLYRILKELFESDEWDDLMRCPACNSVCQEPLDHAVRLHLESYKRVSELEGEIHDKWKTGRWTSRMKSLEECSCLKIPQKERKFGEFDKYYSREGVTVQVWQAAADYLKHLDQCRKTKVEELSLLKQGLERELPPSLVTLTTQIEYAERLQQALSEIETVKKSAEELQRGLSLRNKWVDFIGYATTSFASAEVALSTSQTTALDTQYRQMYESVTSNPEVMPVLQKSQGSEDLHLRLQKFYSLENVSAATLLPESYRNAFAISIYLSASLKSHTPARFMVLDDVTSSFDAGHQYQLMELLRTEVAYPNRPDGPQIIILSHDGLLEKYFDSMASKGNWRHHRLQGLPPVGSVSSHSQGTARIRDSAENFLRAGQVKQAEPLMRQHLEFQLLKIIRNLNIPVPIDFSIRDDRKMVSNCVEAIKEAVDLHRRAGTLILDATQVNELENVHMPALMANWVSHYPTSLSSSISPYVYLGVLDSIDRLMDCFSYNCTCSTPAVHRFYKSLSQRGCSC